jgi:hypothetical protein
VSFDFGGSNASAYWLCEELITIEADKSILLAGSGFKSFSIVNPDDPTQWKMFLF